MDQTISRTYGGRQISVVTVRLLSKSCWFAVTPLPEDRREVTVKADAGQHLPDESRLPAEPVLSRADLQTLGYEIMNDEPPPFRFYWKRGEERSNGSFLHADVAHDDAIEDAFANNELSRCDDCGKVHTQFTLSPVKKLSMRVEAGGTMPSGECDCGALAYPIAERP